MVDDEASEPARVLAQPTPAAIRDELQRLVIADLHGPLGGEYEEFGREAPTDRYLLGRLAPEGSTIEPDDQDDTPDVGDQDPNDPPAEPAAPNITSLAPSSLGCTVYVTGDNKELTATASWASYERVPNESDTGPSIIWRRKPARGTVTVTLNDGNIAPQTLNADYPEVLLRGRARRHDGNWLISLFLVNAQPKPSALRDSAWLFQVELTLTGPQAETPVFLPRPGTVSGGDDADRKEQRRLAMAHRLTPEFAVGHGAGVHITTAPGNPMRATQVRTESVPSYEVPFTDVPDADSDDDLPGLRSLVLDMKELAERPDLTADLTPLVTAYRGWIDAQEATLTEAERHLSGYQQDARDALKAARRAAARIQAGIDLLSADQQAQQAFRFANRAMHLQRVHIKATEARAKNRNLPLDQAAAEADIPRNRSWRPFQLAFLLLSLPALTDPEHPERAAGSTATADLLWFPTGGGKTEAYLGLTAYTLAIRRLQQDLGGPNSTDGVAVLMRYTLRLLTIQQFQRAAALICACEVIRREDPVSWGDVPFRIGLWVGSRVTPNRTNDAADWLKQQRGGRGAPPRALGSPYQLTACPWCGMELQPGRDINVDMVIRRTLVTCPDPFCDFGMSLSDHDGLPVVVVDEEIYRLLPSLIIGTVDKFAQLTWRGETRSLFGRVTRKCTRHGYVTDDLMATDWELSSDTSRHDAKSGHAVAHMERVTTPLRPPDLIIQDELHLISGPLGSLTGLYEAAVDRLATWEINPNGSGILPTATTALPARVRPKVIASSATVRRAPRQIGALFDRHTEVFPPPGIDIGDNFFSRQRTPQQHPGRRYVGICAHGVRTRSVLIRVYVSVLGASQKVHEKYGKNPITDPYMTLVGYFNSLRDLGGMRRLVEDDVSARLTRAEERGLARRYDPLLKELTSRLSSTDIPAILEQLSVSFPRVKDATPPIDVLLATNMIAVGVDVSRLGVMVVASQPKSTAEYVQATSRVGRAAPGLVFTVFNWARPRDLSHYETFEHFHATFYQHVEALSVTPFSDRAVDRGLTGVLVALVREMSAAYNGNTRAGSFDRNDELADHVVRYLKRRAENVTGDKVTGVAVEQQLDARLDQWNKERRVPGRRLVYDITSGADDMAPLLRRPDGTAWRRMTCPTSLRDVEPGIRLLLFPEGDSTEVVAEPPFEPVVVPDDAQPAEAVS
jgi:hypothetical protein